MCENSAPDIPTHLNIPYSGAVCTLNIKILKVYKPVLLVVLFIGGGSPESEFPIWGKFLFYVYLEEFVFFLSQPSV